MTGGGGRLEAPSPHFLKNMLYLHFLEVFFFAFFFANIFCEYVEKFLFGILFFHGCTEPHVAEFCLEWSIIFLKALNGRNSST